MMDVASYDYIALVFFIIFAIFVPVSYIITSKLLRANRPRNAVKNAPYESAEQPIGKSRDVDNEYLAFFAIFLPFEIISVVVLLWAVIARQLPLTTNVSIIGLVIISMALAFAGYKFTTEK